MASGLLSQSLLAACPALKGGVPTCFKSHGSSLTPFLGSNNLDLGASLASQASGRAWRRLVPRASVGPSDAENDAVRLRRRELLATAAVLGSAAVMPQLAVADEDALGEWEQVDLPIDPKVVLLDLAFVPTDPSRGFLLGTRQTFLETKDGGRTWAPRQILQSDDEESDFNYRFQSISFDGDEGWIVGKPAILLHTTDGGKSWQRVPLSARLPGNPVLIKATGEKGAEMVTDEGAVYVTSNAAYSWKAAVEETVAATLNRTVSSGISGASYYTGTFANVNRSEDGSYVAVSSRGNFYMTWEPGQAFWQPHNRTSTRRIQNMGWTRDNRLWLLTRGGGLFTSTSPGAQVEDFEEQALPSRGFGLLDLAYRSEKEAWAAGGSGSLFKSVDNGKSWSRDKAADQIAANLYTIKFVDEKRGFVLGSNAVLLRYTG